MTQPEPVPREQAAALVELYDEALPQVYGYLVARCRNAALAEDLTAETFLGAVTAIRERSVDLTVAFLIGVARHKLFDHWRAEERKNRPIALVPDGPDTDDPWDERLDAMRARETLAGLLTDQRVALTLRYVDGLAVPEVADCMGRSVHATESLLARARGSFRRAYGGED